MFSRYDLPLSNKTPYGMQKLSIRNDSYKSITQAMSCQASIPKALLSPAIIHDLYLDFGAFLWSRFFRKFKFCLRFSNAKCNKNFQICLDLLSH